MIICFFLHSVNMIHCIDWFSFLKSLLYLIVSICLICCWFVEDYCIYIHKEYCFLVMPLSSFSIRVMQASSYALGSILFYFWKSFWKISIVLLIYFLFFIKFIDFVGVTLITIYRFIQSVFSISVWVYFLIKILIFRKV